jgi:CelD/BcsL family acetyltransferase involved in cellulose biosynthesis
MLGHGPADQLGPVGAPAYASTALATVHHIMAAERLDLVLLDVMPAGIASATGIGAEVLVRESSPTLSLAAGWDGFLASRSANFRHQIRARERRLENRHDLRFRLATDPGRLGEDLTVLFALHRSRWGSKSPFLRWERFHREFARVALERSWLRLWFLELDSRPVAAWYGFRYAGAEAYYQAGRDVTRDEDSLGFVLLAHTIREAANDGIREYRLLRGAEPFKLRFADADHALETAAVTRGVRGAVGQAAAKVALRTGLSPSALRRGSIARTAERPRAPT